MVSRSFTRPVHWTKHAPPKGEYGEKDPKALHKGAWPGTGGRVAKLMVAISHGKGVVVCERYQKMDANYFAFFIDQNFNTMFERSRKGLGQLWLQDGDPSQNSKAAHEAVARCHSELLKILPRSPDLNPIENIFHIVSKRFEKDLHALAKKKNITRESYEQFYVQRTINGISYDVINKTIQSMSFRVADIIRNSGGRLKY